jgi:hypothetical protein
MEVHRPFRSPTVEVYILMIARTGTSRGPNEVCQRRVRQDQLSQPGQPLGRVSIWTIGLCAHRDFRAFWVSRMRNQPIELTEEANMAATSS